MFLPALQFYCIRVSSFSLSLSFSFSFFCCCCHYHDATSQCVNSFVHWSKPNLRWRHLPRQNAFHAWYFKSRAITQRAAALVTIAGAVPRGWSHEAAAPSLPAGTPRMTGGPVLMRRLTFTSTRPPLCPPLLRGITVTSAGGTGSRLRAREK